MTENSRPPRITLADLAQLTEAGSATVDRVINKRGNVLEEVRQ